VYIVYDCTADYIEFGWPFNSSIDRENMGTIIVVLDLLITFSFILSIMIITRLAEREKARSKEYLVETKDFALEFINLPALTKTYNIHILKAELWKHIEKHIKEEKQQISELADHDPV